MTQPGWYPDPANPAANRYWDGARWLAPAGLAGPQAKPRDMGATLGGLVTIAVGLVALVVSYTVLRWFNFDFADQTFKFHDLTDDPGVTGFPAAYFSWLGWVLLVAAAGLAVAACVHGTHQETFRYLGLIAGIIGMGVTVLAVGVLGHKLHESASDFIGQWSAGVWVAAVAYLVIGGGAMIGGRR